MELPEQDVILRDIESEAEARADDDDAIRREPKHPAAVYLSSLGIKNHDDEPEKRTGVWKVSMASPSPGGPGPSPG
jgi:hypothetical protein